MGGWGFRLLIVLGNAVGSLKTSKAQTCIQIKFSGCLLHPKGSLKIQMERRRLVAKWRLLIKL